MHQTPDALYCFEAVALELAWPSRVKAEALVLGDEPVLHQARGRVRKRLARAEELLVRRVR